MKPRKALITSAAVAATLVSASAAMALNGGILGNNSNDGVGNLNPMSGIAEISSTTISVPGPVAIAASDEPVVTTSSASTVSDANTDESYEDDNDDDDESYESDDDDDDDEDEEYEGYDSDD